MYNNKYYLEMRIPGRISSPFSSLEEIRIENSRLEHNDAFATMSRKQTNNKKYISQITSQSDGTLGIYLETEFPISNIERIGNALRLFSLIAIDNGLNPYIKNKKLLKSA